MHVDSCCRFFREKTAYSHEKQNKSYNSPFLFQKIKKTEGWPSSPPVFLFLQPFRSSFFFIILCTLWSNHKSFFFILLLLFCFLISFLFTYVNVCIYSYTSYPFLPSPLCFLWVSRYFSWLLLPHIFGCKKSKLAFQIEWIGFLFFSTFNQ